MALQAEAKPLIDHLNLKKIQSWQPFPVYATNDTQLIISGIGRCNSAAATTWLAGLSPSRADDPWLNLGIAGHRDKPAGALFCGHKITEETTNKSWYPVQVSSPIGSTNLLTVDRVTTDYRDDTLHEMEASGFYSAALRFSTSEIIQCLKIVSDNKHSRIENINKDFVIGLVNENLEPIRRYIEYLSELSAEIQSPTAHSLEKQLTEKWNFSVTQTRQLQRLLQRHTALDWETDLLDKQLRCESLSHPSQVLDIIKNHLANAPISIN